MNLIKTVLPLFLATGLYLWQAGIFLMQGNKAMALVFIGYAVANLGLIVAAA